MANIHRTAAGKHFEIRDILDESKEESGITVHFGTPFTFSMPGSRKREPIAKLVSAKNLPYLKKFYTIRQIEKLKDDIDFVVNYEVDVRKQLVKRYYPSRNKGCPS
jgi:hypothetical protein